MNTRSWLAKAKTIQDLGGMYYAPKAGEPWDHKRDAQAEAKWDRNFKRPMPVSEADRPYFGSWMHDAGVVRIEREGSLLRVRLDNIAARDFVHILARCLDLPMPERVWPVDLLLHDPSYVRAAIEGHGGSLRFADWQNLGDGSGLTPTEFLYDWFWEQDGRLQWIAHLYRLSPHLPRGTRDVYLMVDCARATAEDRCPAAFGAAFGSPGRMLYEEARANAFADEDFNLWNEAGLKRSLPGRLAAHGLARDDFL